MTPQPDLTSLDYLYHQGLSPAQFPGVSGVGVGSEGLPYLNGLAAQLPSTSTGLAARFGLANGVGFQGPSFLGGSGELGLAGLAGKALPPFLAGQLATAGINNLLPSTGTKGDVRQVLGDAATGAGIGAAIAAPTVVATPLGAAIGGVLGGAYGALDSLFGGGDSEPDYKKALTDSASQLGLDPLDYTAAFDLLTKSGADKKQVGSLLAQQLLQDSAQHRAQQQQTQLQAAQRQSDQTFALALQQKAQEFFAPYTNNIVTSGVGEAAALRSLADSVPAPFRQSLLSQASLAEQSSQNIASAYAAQSAMLPSQYMYSADLKRQDDLANLAYQQAVIQAQTARSGGGFQQLSQQSQGTGG